MNLNDSEVYKSYLISDYRSVKHNTYFPVYDQLFSRFRNKEIIFVEVGVLNGGSLLMWRDYFGPQARIIGIDLNPAAKYWETHGFEIYIGSQKDTHFWKSFVESITEFDIVLDDGGHTYAQQIVTVDSLLPHIKDGGILVIEDTHTSYMHGFYETGFFNTKIVSKIKYYINNFCFSNIKENKWSFISYTKFLIDKINHRFSGLNNKNSDKIVWSIEFFESIVAFKINKTATSQKSSKTDNGGKTHDASDFRHDDATSIDVKKYFS